MISRMMFLAVNNKVRVFSVSEKKRINPVLFEGEDCIEIKEDFWDNWKLQTSYVEAVFTGDENGTIIDFCFITDKEYEFQKAEFLNKSRKIDNSVWNTNLISDVFLNNDLLDNLGSAVSIELADKSKMRLGTESEKAVTLRTNIIDNEYTLFLKEQKKAEREAKKKVSQEKAFIMNSDAEDNVSFAPKMVSSNIIEKTIDTVSEQETNLEKYFKKIRKIEQCKK